MRKIQKLAAYLLIGVLIFSGKDMRTQAAQEIPASVDNQKKIDLKEDSDSAQAEEAIAGIDLTLNKCYQNMGNADKKIKQYLMTDNNLAFSRVGDYVNIRSTPDCSGEILGKLYKNGAATIISKKNGWCLIESGSVKGYIKSDFLVTGEKAAALAKSVGERVATVTTETLKVREKAAQDARVIALVPVDDEFKVVKEQKNWAKIMLNKNEYGYVSSDYINIHIEYEEAVSIEEKQNNDTSVSNTSSSSSSSNLSADGSETSDSTNKINISSPLRSKITTYALQFIGNPYVWGGTSLTNGIDCSGFTQSVLAHFGISIPRTSREQASCGSAVAIANLKPGDLVFYAKNGSINHVAFYIGNGEVISASSPSTGIRITNINYRQPCKAVSYIG